MSKPKSTQKFEISCIERQIVNALKQDVDSLAKQFVAAESMSIDAFASLFVDKEFSTIFLGRLSVSDFAEFVENFFLYCVRYAVAEPPDNESRIGAQSSSVTDEYPPYVVAGAGANRGYDMIRIKLRTQKRTIKERIFGVYMCYCLYFLQPPNFVVPIRVTVREMEAFYRLAHDVLLIDDHLEPLYCLYRLFDASAFAVTPFEAEFNPLIHRRFDAYDEEGDMATELSELELAEDFSLLKQLADDVTLKQLTSIHETYARMKNECRLPGMSQTAAGPMDVAGYVQKLLHETMTAFADERRRAMSGRGDSAAESSARHRRSRIRQSAYASVASPMHQSRRQRTHHDSNEAVEGPSEQEARASTSAQPPMLPAKYALASPPKRTRSSMSKKVKMKPVIEAPSGIDDKLISQPAIDLATDRPNLRRSLRKKSGEKVPPPTNE